MCRKIVDECVNHFKELLYNSAFCFALDVSLSLAAQENVYPKGASVQFYKLYLDPSVRRHVTEYDALAIIEWDVLVAHNTRYASLLFIPLRDVPMLNNTACTSAARINTPCSYRRNGHRILYQASQCQVWLQHRVSGSPPQCFYNNNS